MREKHHKGKRHLSGKELLEKRIRERKEDDRQFIRVCASYPASLFMNTRINSGG